MKHPQPNAEGSRSPDADPQSPSDIDLDAPKMRDYLMDQRSLHIHAISQLNHLLNNTSEAFLNSDISQDSIDQFYQYPLKDINKE